MRKLRQSTAVVVPVGPFLGLDGLTPVTTLTTQAGRLVKGATGGAFAATSWAHDANGIYLVGFSTTHTDTRGNARLSFSDPATYAPVWEDFEVVSAAAYDFAYGAIGPASAFPTVDITGVVAASPTPTATAVTVTLDTPLDVGTVAGDFVGLYVTYTSGPRLPRPGQIATAAINSTTSVTFTFAAGAFPAAPTAGNSVMISG